MAVRNFYVEAAIDGRSGKVAGGPAAKDGEMVVTIYQRDHGEIVKAFSIVCREKDGSLTSTVVCNADQTLEPVRFETQR